MAGLQLKPPELPKTGLEGLGIGGLPELGIQYKQATQARDTGMQEFETAAKGKSDVHAQGAQTLGDINAQAPATPQLQQMPAYKPQGLSNEEMTGHMQTMFALAAIGGIMTRRPMTNAIKAFTGALKGLNAGDAQLYQRGMQQFKLDSETALNKNREAMEAYKLELEKNKGDYQTALQQINLKASAFGDTMTAALAKVGDAKAVINHLQSMAQNDQNAKIMIARIEEGRVKDEMRHQETIAREGRMASQFQAQQAQQQRQFDERMAAQNRGLDIREATAPGGAGKPPTEGERKGALYFNQMASAEKEIGDIVGPDFDINKLGNQITARMAGSDYTNWAASAEAQRYKQATEQWAEAYLRLKTGAATNKSEIERNARTFFPQPFDKPGVIDQKNRMRIQAQNDVKLVAGRLGGAQAGPPGNNEAAEAQAAIQRGADPARVRARYKERTGQDLP